MTWKGALLVSVRLPDVVNNVVMDATERGSQAATGERGQAIELFSYLLSLRPRSFRSIRRSLRPCSNKSPIRRRIETKDAAFVGEIDRMISGCGLPSR